MSAEMIFCGAMAGMAAAALVQIRALFPERHLVRVEPGRVGRR